jgi:hypothetical protein
LRARGCRLRDGQHRYALAFVQPAHDLGVVEVRRADADDTRLEASAVSNENECWTSAHAHRGELARLHRSGTLPLASAAAIRVRRRLIGAVLICAASGLLALTFGL